MTKKTYDYLVAYNFSTESSFLFGSGTIQLSRNKKIKTFDDIKEINNLITERNEGFKNVNVYNFILLGRNKH